MAISLADLMHSAITLVSQYGEPNIVSDDGVVLIYAQTSNELVDGYFPVHTEGFAEDEVDSIVEAALEANIGLVYDPKYADVTSDSTFSAFVLHPAPLI